MELPGKDDVTNDTGYDWIVDAFKTMGFDEEEVDVVWSICAFCMLLSNLEFDDSSYDGDSTPCKISNPDFLVRACKTL